MGMRTIRVKNFRWSRTSRLLLTLRSPLLASQSWRISRTARNSSMYASTCESVTTEPKILYAFVLSVQIVFGDKLAKL